MLLCELVLSKETVQTACLKHSAAVMYHGREISCKTHVQVSSITTNRVKQYCFVVIVGVHFVNCV
jgi:hypothetical protein